MYTLHREARPFAATGADFHSEFVVEKSRSSAALFRVSERNADSMADVHPGAAHRHPSAGDQGRSFRRGPGGKVSGGGAKFSSIHVLLLTEPAILHCSSSRI